MLVLNAFSASMLDLEPAPAPTGDLLRAACPVNVTFKVITEQQARAMLVNGFVSAVGHADTAALFSNILGVDIRPNRVSVTPLRRRASPVGPIYRPKAARGHLSTARRGQNHVDSG